MHYVSLLSLEARVRNALYTNFTLSPPVRHRSVTLHCTAILPRGRLRGQCARRLRVGRSVGDRWAIGAAMSKKRDLVDASNRLSALILKLSNPPGLRKTPLLIDEARFVLELAKEQFMAKPKALIDVPAPTGGEKLVIGGDTHGQYRDAVRIFELNGWPEHQNYVFLGDYVDRGTRNIETICLMFCLKAMYRKKFHILRGNHESAEINKHYGFRAELMRRFGEDEGHELWKEFNDCFDWMPLAALIGESIFCMHGGIPAKQMSKNFDELRKMPMPIRVIRGNPIAADLLWSDPSDDVDEFVPNPRGLGHQFGSEQLEEFLTRHDLDVICRAHQVFHEGYKLMYLPRRDGPCLITVFSAPNYGGEFKNRAAVLVLDHTMQLRVGQVAPYE